MKLVAFIEFALPENGAVGFGDTDQEEFLTARIAPATAAVAPAPPATRLLLRFRLFGRGCGLGFGGRGQK